MHPVPSEERVAAIDTLRGVALFGVLTVNLLGDFRAPFASHLLGNEEPLGPAGGVLMAVIGAMVETKALTLFAFLFGVGVAMQARWGAAFLLRRFAALLAIGIVHMTLIWNGDILAQYAVCAVLLVPLLRLPDWLLVPLGLVLIAVPHLAPLPVPFPDDHELRSLSVQAVRAYRDGAWRELMSFRYSETRRLVVPLLMLTAPMTLGLMLWGAVAWRRGLLTGQPGAWLRAAIVGGAVGALCIVRHADQAAAVPLAFTYAALVLMGNPRAGWLAAAGRMALTNYLMQSVVFGFVFYSYGLGLYASQGVAVTLAGGIAFYCVQLAWSRWWLRRFHHGPVEWLWRSASYMRWQPFARVTPQVRP